MGTLLIVKAGDTFPQLAKEAGDFEDWIRAGLAGADDVRVADPRKEALPSHGTLAGIVVTGSHEMVTDRAAWSEATGAWLRAAVHAGVPVLGICYGHQLLADCLGGQVAYHPGGMEIGTVPVRLHPHAASDPLLRDLPLEFPAHVVHSQSVRRLPEGATLLAGNAFEPVQAFRFGKCAWGVQFHPEFSAHAMRGYVDQLKADAAKAKVVETPQAASVLRSFARYAAA